MSQNLRTQTKSGASRSERSDANHKLYALTITYLPTYHDKEKQYRVTPQERKHLVLLGKLYVESLGICFIKCVIEDQEGKPHMHATVSSRVRIYPFPKLKGYRLHFVPVYGLEGWSSYCKKEDTPAYQQKAVEQYFKTTYAFDEL